MDWLQNDWIWVAAAAGFVVMHFFGHRGHGHGGHNQGRDNREPDFGGKTGAKDVTDRAEDGFQARAGHRASSPPSSARQHRHGC